MNSQTETNSPNEILPIEKQNDFGFSWFYILVTLLINTFLIFIINLYQITQTGFNTIGILQLDLSFQYGLTPLYFALLASDGILLLGMGLVKLIKKPIGLIVFQLFCSIAIIGLYYSRLADDYFMDSQYIVTCVILISATLIIIKLYQIIKQDVLFKKTIWFWGALAMILINCSFLINLLINPTQTPAIFRVFEYNRSAQNKIDMRKIVPESQFLNFDIVYTEDREQEKFMYADFKADLKQNNVDRYAIWATVEVLIQRKIDTRRETMGNKIQLIPTVTAYYNCSCSSSDCSNRQAKGQIKGESDQACDISWRNGIYRLHVTTSDATLDEFMQMAKMVAKNSEYLK